MTEQMQSFKGAHAIVLGGGIAGLATAGTLTRHFAEVTLIERDRYPDRADVRQHTPHGAHVHILLAGGLVTLSRLIPELASWLDEMGRDEADLTHHTRVAYEGRWLPRARSGVPIRPCTRAEVEQLLLRNVRRHASIRVLDGSTVQSLVGDGRITGVKFTREGVSDVLSADLVVDAMGRGTPSRRWLEAAGLSAVEELTVDAGVVYASAWFEPPKGIDDDWVALATLPAIPREPHMGVAIRFGPDRMLCSAIGYGSPRPPRTIDEMAHRMEALCVPHLARLVRASKATSDVVVYANTQNRWRRWGRLPRFPDGLVIIGDAVCSLNPRYGQGMTVASLGAERLDRELDAHFARHGNLTGFSHRFQRSLEAVLAVPWQIALMEDRSWVSVLSGAAPSPLSKLVLAGSQRVLQTAFSDIDTYIRFMRLAHLLDAPTRMLAPRTLARIARGGHRAGEPEAPSIGLA
ncbi:FAD-dependent monooxygenase [Pendulispora rubella]|uniref:FAD-dependent monooxygenase n=1 Tax=Pendulispora rubella TaxID=2741070 RepID=A0ABZ2KSE0_9BACT